MFLRDIKCIPSLLRITKSPSDKEKAVKSFSNNS